MTPLPLHELALGIYQQSADGMLVVDPHTLRIAEANAVACRLLGYASEEITLQDIACVEASIEDGYYWDDVRCGRCTDIDWMHGYYRRRDGTVFAVEKRIARFEAAGRALLLIVFRAGNPAGSPDNERVRTPSLLSAILEATEDGVLVTRTDGRITNMNHRFARMWGIPEALLEAGNDEAIFAYLRDCTADGDEYRRRLEQVMRNQCRSAFDTIHLRDGRCFERYVTPLRVRGRASGQVFSFRDISARLADDAARRALEAQLRESQKMEAMGTLAGGIAHDFNNILAAIIGNASLASRDLPRENPAQDSLEQIRRASVRGRKLVEQILTFSRRQVQERMVQPLRPLVEESLGLLRATLPAVVRLEEKLFDAPLHVRADATQIEQVLMNLCSNAWQSLGGSSGRIEVVMDDVRLDELQAGRIWGLQAGAYARLAVRDNGRGMDEATQARMFEPFFTTRAPDQGTGLGLAVVHGIVKGHGGAIRVRSAPGNGTTVEVLLPLEATPVPAPCAPEAEMARPAGDAAVEVPAHPSKGKHVLYVDDDEALVYLMRRQLERLGYRVSTFDNPGDALAALRSGASEYDLVVSDYNMPGASGLDLAQEVRRIREELPVVITTGFITEELRAGAAAAGVRHLACKPDSTDGLCAIVAQLLSPPATAAL